MTKKERDEARRLCEAAPAHEGQTWFPAEWAEVEFYEAARTALPAALDALDECIAVLRVVYDDGMGDERLPSLVWVAAKNALRKLGELPEGE